MKTPVSQETFVTLSRGLRDHLQNLSGIAVKLYILLLILAKFSGRHKGKVAASFKDLSLELRVHHQTVYKAAQELKPVYITWEPAKNQHSVTVFSIQKYKTIGDFASSRRANSKAKSCTKSEATAWGRQGDSTPRKSKGQHELLDRNKENKGDVVSSASQTSALAQAKEYAREKFKEKFAQYPDWKEKDFVQLAGLWKRNRNLAFEQFQGRWDAYLASTELFIRKQGGSLAYFCANFDHFIDGPLHDSQGGRDGKRLIQPRSSRFDGVGRKATDAAVV